MCRYLLLMVAVWNAGACTTTLRVPSAAAPGEPGLEGLRTRAEREVADVVTAETVWRYATVRVDPGALAITTGWDTLSVPLERVHSVVFTSSRRGALEGVAAGVGLAAVAGLAAAALGGEGESDGSDRRERGLRVGAAVGVFAVPFGFVIGIGGGHRTIFEIVP